MGFLDDLMHGMGLDTPEDKARRAQDEANEKAADAKKKADEANAEAKKAQDEANKTPGETTTATPATKPAAPPAAKVRTYTVKKGDTLSEIGQRYGVSWHEIAKVNHIDNPDLIFPGQVFKIPE